MQYIKPALAVMIAVTVLTANAAYAKQEKYTICHIEDIYEVNEAGEQIVVDSVTETKSLPAGAVRAHDAHEADHLPDTYTVGEDSVLSCTAIQDSDGNDLTPTELGSTDLVESLGIPDKASGKDKDKPDRPDNIADVIHPKIHQNNGPGQNANPNGANDGGGQMHGIGSNPGHSDNEPGVANLANVHGGIGAVNKNVE